MLSDAWREVKAQTIKSCSGKTGFKNNGSDDTDEIETVPPPGNLSLEEFEVIVNQDLDLEICRELTDVEIIQDVKRQRTESPEEEEEEEDDQQQQSKKELLDMINGMKRFVQQRGK